MRTILLKYGELILKGANKKYFEKLLLKQVTERVKKIGGADIRYMQSTVYITPNNDDDTEEMFESVKKVFGIATLCIARRVEKDFDAIMQTVASIAPEELRGYKTFKVEAKRSDKAFPYKSPEICAEAGGQVLDTCPWLTVDVINPEITLIIEVRDEYAFIHAGREKGAGGMPKNSSGRALLLLSGGIDSPVAGYMMARRGVEVEALHFESFPYTSERAKEKVLSLAKLVCEYTDTMRVNIISLTEIQEEIRKHCDEDYFTIILRRFMMRLARRVAGMRKCGALITGESVGQVASQTMGALRATDSVVNIPVFRPCIGMDKEDIVTVARNINTFETSILPYEDCCTVFTPRHPKLNPDMERIEAEEAKLDYEALFERAYATRTQVTVTRD